ncbi:MAG: cache domain-containing protein [Desulfobacterales bacterium]|nr:cache domain-containing protein [Desulfobacterales bacterium]
MGILKFKPRSIRFKLIASLILVSASIGVLCLLVGGNFLYQSVIQEVNHRIRQDLNVARLIYDDRVDSIRQALEVAASHFSPPNPPVSITAPNLGSLKLDFLGRVDLHTRENEAMLTHPLLVQVLEHQRSVAGTLVLTAEQLAGLSPELAARAKIPIGAKGAGIDQGLVMGAAVPVVEKDRLRGIIYGGFLLNRDRRIVDKIEQTVFRNEIYQGRRVGTATLFFKDIRIATNVKDALGRRALGSLASPEVSQRVLGEGKPWTDRAKVLDQWYITAYEPILSIEGERVGMFYVGVLEAKYLDVRKRGMLVFFLITCVGTFLAIALGWLLTNRILQPVSSLIRASREISKGNFSPEFGPAHGGDMGQLQDQFKEMSQALEKREKRQRLKSQIQLLQSEKQASIGKLAAGVAHEINNPLTAVLTFSHLLLRRSDLDKGMKADLEMIASQTERVRKIVRSLLNFSRQSNLAPEQTDINRLIVDSVRLMKNQALVKGIHLSSELDATLPDIILDRNQIQSVMINMILNALDATPSGGKITISVGKEFIDHDLWVRISIADTGCGISPENIPRLFDPFFTTKEIGKGTGLGLAVSSGIIQRHGGTMEVSSKPGAGSLFTICLPRDPEGGIGASS